jgi:hypothetical protein
MRPVAEWLAGRGLAAAPRNLFTFGNFHKHRPHARGPVGTVAERLLLGQAATAPYITAGLYIHDKWMISAIIHFCILTNLRTIYEKI